MAVTYAWKIDSGLYSYIVNTKCLNDNSELKTPDQYLSSPDSRYSTINAAIQDALNRGEEETAMALYQDVYMGDIMNAKLEDDEEAAIREFCKSQWGAANDLALESYTYYFNSMLDKIHDYDPKGTGNRPYAYVDLLSAEAYFNVDADCGSIGDGTYDPMAECISSGNRITSGTTMSKSVGYIPSGTKASDLSGKCFSEIINMILFDTVEHYPTSPTLPGVSLTVSDPDTDIFYVGSGATIYNSKYIGLSASASKTSGRFNGNGYTMSVTPLYTSSTVTFTKPSEVSSISTGVQTLTWSASYSYGAPTNSPVTSKGNEYTASTATWVAGTATASVSKNIYVVDKLQTNFSYNVSGGKYVANSMTSDTDYDFVPISANQTVFLINIPESVRDTYGQPLTIELKRGYAGTAVALSKIEVYNTITGQWDLQEEGKNNDYTISNNVLTYNGKVYGDFRITLENSLQ